MFGFITMKTTKTFLFVTAILMLFSCETLDLTEPIDSNIELSEYLISNGYDIVLKDNEEFSVHGVTNENRGYHLALS